jgi:XTP/dITP diphosphohydrolase
MSRVRWLVATTNAHKLGEIQVLLGSEPIEVLSLAALPPVPEPAETGATFAENARLKAVAYAAATGIPTIAEDSGLEIDALDGRPGVHSARYLGADASYPERFAKILRELDARPAAPRSARFVSAVVVVRQGAVVFDTCGVIEGEIARAPSGAGGFGYDPIFYYPPFGKTLADVSQEEKLTVAHRGHAFRALAAWLRNDASR